MLIILNILNHMKNRKIEELEKQLGPRIAGSGPELQEIEKTN